MNLYLKGLLQKHLNEKEYQVLRLSYGLDCDKHSAKEIAAVLKIEGNSNYVRVSELKKAAVNKLIDNVDHSQVLDYLQVKCKISRKTKRKYVIIIISNLKTNE